MPSRHFISYSTIDAHEFVVRLHHGLETGVPPIPTWLDKDRLKPGDRWDVEIEKAIPACASLLYVVTTDSVEFQSECRRELDLALACKRPIIPIRFHAAPQMPYRCLTRQHIDFTGDFDIALEELRQHLIRLASPQGTLDTLTDRLDDAKHDLRHARDESQRTRIEKEMIELEKQIAVQEKIVADPKVAAARVVESINRGMERERVPETPVAREAGRKFINPPPTAAPAYFQDRDIETKLILEFLRNDGQRLITVVGRGGVGKTAMVCRLLHELENGRVPDGTAPLQVDGIVYLSASGLHRINLANLFADLCKLVPFDVGAQLDAIYRNPLSTVETKMEALLDVLRDGLVVVLLDNFEDLLDPETHKIRDDEFSEALIAFLSLPQHAVKIIITTRIAPQSYALVQRARQVQLDLDEGLPSPYAETILREMDVDGKVGLKSASAELLLKAQLRTRGYPRALEALFAILSADRGTSLEEIIEDTGKMLPSNVVEDLVGQAFNRLDNAARQVMQALAIYARPVPPVAIDYLLQPYLPGVDSASALGRLVNMHYVRKEAGRYYLHPIDREYALSTLEAAPNTNYEIEDRNSTQRTLRMRAADYFEQTRTPRDSWKSIRDLTPQLSEFDIRCAALDYDMAATVLLSVDYRYLYFWGHFQQMVDLHTQLRGKIDDRSNQQQCLGNLGIALAELGRITDAKKVTEEALKISIDAGLGHHASVWLGNLGTFDSDIGETERAVERHLEALVISRRIGGNWLQAVSLGNLGCCYADLGEVRQAEDALDEALKFAQVGGDEARWAVILAYRAELFIDDRNNLKAKETADFAIDIARPTNVKKVLTLGHRTLALANLFDGDLDAARGEAEKACEFDLPQFKHSCLVLLGMIALRQNDATGAQQFLSEALDEAEKVVAHNHLQFRAWDSKGLALAAFALAKGQVDFAEAEAAHRRAREIAMDAGVVTRMLRLYRELAVCDPNDYLSRLRPAVAGDM